MEQIIATHRVKPSSPTPLDSKTHKLSILDQIRVPVYIPLIFFYRNDESEQPTEISRRLKQSLSETLTIFYPFAGTIRDNSYVDCNDRGIELVEAQRQTHLAHFLTQHPDVEELKQLLPAFTMPKDERLLILLVKVSYFDCGGFAVGVCLWHKIGDASSLTMFMNAWAATCRGEASRIIPPSFDLALHFPPTDKFTDRFSHVFAIEKVTTKRFVFEREKLEKLKKEASSYVEHPTSVEALSAFIWKTAVKAYKSEPRGALTLTAPFVGCQAVNLRSRTVPPIPDHAIGNCITMSVAFVSWEEDERESGVHVSKMRAAIREVDNDYINHVIKDSKKLLQKLGELPGLGKPGDCVISSWWRFPLYEVDFGWGKPVWVCPGSFSVSNRVILISTPSQDGIEAWISASSDNHHFLHLLQTICNNLLLH